LDEPTNGLDPTQIRQMRDLIRELAKSATVIVSTHILQEVQAVCQRVLILRAGRLVVDERLEALDESHAMLVEVAGDVRGVLGRLEGVAAVQALDPVADRQRYRIAATRDAAPRVAAALAAAGLPLYRLEPERQDLETLFARVNDASALEAAHG